jgi:hypothetical protein
MTTAEANTDTTATATPAAPVPGSLVRLLAESHTHDLPLEVVREVLDVGGPWPLGRVSVRGVELPEGFVVPCGLYGPAMGDAPVVEADVAYAPRPGREWATRGVDRPMREVGRITVVVGPNPADEGELALYTIYGGAEAPRELGDPSLNGDAAARAASEAFWAEHALAMPRPKRAPRAPRTPVLADCPATDEQLLAASDAIDEAHPEAAQVLRLTLALQRTYADMAQGIAAGRLSASEYVAARRALMEHHCVLLGMAAPGKDVVDR